MSNEQILSGSWPVNFKGRGTVDEPWEIGTTEELLLLQIAVNSGNDFSGKNIKLTHDIVLTENVSLPEDFSVVENIPLTEKLSLTEKFTLHGEVKLPESWDGLGDPVVTTDPATYSPVVTGGTGFAGTLDGGGKTIEIHKTVVAPGSDIQRVVGGLVNYLAPDGIVENLTVTGFLTVIGEMDAVGGVVGYNSGTIRHVTNKVVVTAVSSFNVGGIAGFNNGCYNEQGDPVGRNGGSGSPVGEIDLCMNHGSILGDRKVGGITGEDAGMIAQCDNLSNIGGEYDSKDGVGGIAGRLGNNNKAVESGQITGCANLGNISDNHGSWVGGLAGFENQDSSITYGYSINNVTGYSWRDNTAGDNDGGVIEETFGPEENNGAQLYDGTVLMPLNDMSDGDLLDRLNEIDSDTNWVAGPGNFPVPANCGNPEPDDNAESGTREGEVEPLNSVVEMIMYPYTLTYAVGEQFDPNGLVIQRIFANGVRTTVSYTYPKTELEDQGQKTVDVTAEGKTFSIPVDVAVASGNVILGTGKPGEYGTLAGAIKAATGKVILMDGTLPLGSGITDCQGVTIKRNTGFTDIMLTIANGINYDTAADPVFGGDGSDTGRAAPAIDPDVPDNVTLDNLTLEGTQGGDAASLMRMYSGLLNLGDKVILKDNKVPAATVQGDAEKSWQKLAAQRGAGISIQGGTTNLKGTIQDCETVEGGGVSVSGATTKVDGTGTKYVDTVLNLFGSITGCTADKGSAAYVQGVMYIKNNALINGNTADSKGTIFVTYDETSKKAGCVIVEDGKISENTATEGSILYIEGGEATIKGGEHTGNSAAIVVGVLPIMKKGELDRTEIGLLTLDGGTISRDAKGSGTGALIVINGGKVEMDAGTIRDWICVQNEIVVTDEKTGAQELVIGKLFINGGIIGSGSEDAAVMINGGECVMTGGKVNGSEDPGTASSQAICVDCVSVKLKEAQGDAVQTVTKMVKGKFVMHDGEVKGGNASAAVNINGGDAIMEGGTINAGSSYGVRVSCMDEMDLQTKATETIVGTFRMIDGAITGSANAPAVIACGGEFTLEGGKVEAASENDCAIRVNSSSGSKFMLKAPSATIKGRIYLESGEDADSNARIYVAAAIPSSGITIECEDPYDGRVVAVGDGYEISATDAGRVKYANSDFEIIRDGTKLVLEEQ